MIYEVKQIKKELFSAEFEVKNDEREFGKISLQGSISSIEGIWNGNIFDKDIHMNRIKKREIPYKDKIFRPYGINIDGKPVGFVYQSEKKTSFFKSIVFHKMHLFDSDYSIYIIRRGNEGAFYPVYKGDTQIAELHKDNIVYDDLHIFKMFTTKEEYADIVSTIFVMYMYIIGIYKSGVKITRGVSLTYSFDNNEELIKKYNPDFISNNFEDNIKNKKS